MKNYENRISSLEKRMIQQIPDRSIIITTVDDNTKFSIGEKKYAIAKASLVFFMGSTLGSNESFTSKWKKSGPNKRTSAYSNLFLLR